MPHYFIYFSPLNLCKSGGVAKQEYLQSNPVQRRVGERGYDLPEEAAYGDRVTECAPTGDKHQDDLQGRAVRSRVA